MKNYLGLALVFVTLGFFSIGQAFATGQFGIDSSCPDGTYPVTCGPITITVTSENGFSGTVNLSTSVTPSCVSGYCLTPTLNPTSVSLSSGGSATSKLSFTHTCNRFPNCEWLVNITGTSGIFSNTTSVFVCYGRDCPI